LLNVSIKALGKLKFFAKCLSVKTLGKVAVTINFPFCRYRQLSVSLTFFAEGRLDTCSMKNTRQTHLCRVFGCRVVYADDEIMSAIKNPMGVLFFVDGPGSTGKTFQYKALLVKVCS